MGSTKNTKQNKKHKLRGWFDTLRCFRSRSTRCKAVSYEHDLQNTPKIYGKPLSYYQPNLEVYHIISI